ncbi:hypothetical protein DFP72DRAFT_1107103 [Ephemerocybe angulata]|uniref:Ubiquitin-like domain-containing protein n=1 Tax=Ephemerocybe angulata TaxID=980116 RepID=A0A8H6LU44_9AGAR|nr:hypothetical protein DFP72DRAFT_1107103 [Tulosesus angulatus]
MKLPLAPLVSLLFGASYLVANTIAYSYNDYNELDARYQIDDVLSERGFGLEARETIDVPFQPSLRAFLEEATTAHRRSMSEKEEYLEARADDKINVYAMFGDQHLDFLQIDSGMTIGALKKLIVDTGRVPGLDWSNFSPRLGSKWPGKKLDDDSKTLNHYGVKTESKIFFREKLTLTVTTPTDTPGERRTVTVKVPDDTKPPGLKKIVQELVKGAPTAPSAKVRLSRIPGDAGILDSLKTFRTSKVQNPDKIEITFT